MNIAPFYAICLVCILAACRKGQIDNIVEENTSGNDVISTPSTAVQVTEVKNRGLSGPNFRLHPAIYPIILGPSFMLTLVPMSNEAKTAIVSCAFLAAVLVSGLDCNKCFAPQVFEGFKKLSSKAIEDLPDMIYKMYQFSSRTIRFIARPLFVLSLTVLLAVYCNTIGFRAPYHLVMSILAHSPFKYTYSFVKEITSIEE